MSSVSPCAFLILLGALSLAPMSAALAADAPAAKAETIATPKVGDKATDFTLETLDGKTVQLSKLTAESPVVIVVLRGWPGYQCPLCTRQVADLLGKAEQLQAAKARVVLIYPGPAEKLGEHAREFANGKNFKSDFLFVTDPAYKFTNSYGLRWDAPKETAFPSTFVVDAAGVIRYAKISKGHGDRAPASDVLKALGELK